MNVNRTSHVVQIVLVAIAVLLVSAPATANDQIAGEWRGSWVIPDVPVGRWASIDYPTGAYFELGVFSAGGNNYAELYIPELGLFDTVIPAFIVGNEITIPLHPSLPLFIKGFVQADGSLSGFAQVPNPVQPDQLLFANWQSQRPASPAASLPPGADCGHDVPLYCTGDADHCTDLVLFSPSAGSGYLDYPVRDETQGNQYRSFVRRDLARIVQFAAAELECKTADWAYGNKAALGIGDGSHEDGTSPTLHMSHEDGDHLDIAYPQLNTTDNLLRRVGRYIPLAHPDQGTYLMGPPGGLDSLRSALFISYLGRHPNLRYIAVDEEAGILIDDAFVKLESAGWVPQGTRDKIRLLYRKDDVTAGHADHMHVAMQTLEPIVETLRISPRKLQRKSNGRFISAHLKFVDGVDTAAIDIESLSLIVDGHTIISAEVTGMEPSNSDGDSVRNLVVKFDRASLTNVLDEGEAEMAVTGSVDGVFFQASDTISVK